MSLRPDRARSPLLPAAALCAVVLLAAAGCASSPPASAPGPDTAAASAAAETPAAAPDGFYGTGRPEGSSYFGTGSALLDEAVSSIAEATPASLRRAKMLASQADALGAPGAAGAAVVADTLLRRLYPDSPGASDGGGTSWRQVKLSRAFLQDIAPSTDLLDPLATVDASGLAALSRQLAAADSQEPGSPLPPFFAGLVSQRQSVPLAQTRVGFETALKRSPAFWPAAAALSRSIIDAGAAPAELPLLKKLADLLPTPADRFEALARAELAGGQPGPAADAAAQGLLTVTDSAPDRRVTFGLLRAQALERSDDWYQALWVLDAMLRIQPDLAAAELAKARLLHDKGQNDVDALAAVADGEKRHPADPLFPELQGRILLDERKPDEAVTALKKSHDLDPNRVSVLELLASTEARREAWTDAGSWLDQIPAASRTPAQLDLAWRIDTGRDTPDAALKDAQALYQLTSDPHALVLQARSLLTLGRNADALTLIDRQLQAGKNPDAVASDLHFLRSRASPDDAVRDLRSALVENPDNVEALSAMADAMAGLKDYRKAMEYARRAAFLSPGDTALAGKAADMKKLADAGSASP